MHVIWVVVVNETDANAVVPQAGAVVCHHKEQCTDPPHQDE